jgi:hypothetical protein
MLTKMVAKHTPAERVREEEAEYGVQGHGQTLEADYEDEDDDEDD